MPVTLVPAVAPKETGGSPEFPGYPSERMPRSQTPVVSRPLALARTGLLPSRQCTLSAFDPVTRSYPWTTTIHFSEFNDAACALAFPLLRTPPFRRSHFGSAIDLLARLGSNGIFTRWVTMTIFKGVTLFHHPEFISARAQCCPRKWFGPYQHSERSLGRS
jgi:hypothetical protein